MINPETLNIFSLPSLELSQRDCLPEKRVIYFVASLDKIYYIGKAINLKTRWKQHHRYSQVENEEGVLIYWMEVEKNEDLSAWETLLIQYFEPSLNGWILHALEIMPDHVVRFVQADHTTAPVEIAKTMKSISAVHIFNTFKDLKKRRFWGSGMWSDGTFYSSVGGVSQEAVKRYIETHKQRGDALTRKDNAN